MAAEINGGARPARLLDRVREANRLRHGSRSTEMISKLEGTARLMATLLYGSGLRLLECARLRVQDVDFAMNQIVVRDGKGAKDRVTVLPAVAKAPLAEHRSKVKRQHDADLALGAGWVELPWALARKYPNAGREWPWQWFFPATRLYFHQATG